MRIAIDCRWIFPKISGIGKHTKNLIDGLSLVDHHNNYLLLRDPLVSYDIYSLENQIKLPKLLKRLDVHIYHSTNFMIPLFLSRKIRVVVTIHDLIPFIFPQYTPRAKKTKFNWLFKLIIKRAVKRADRIIAVSSTTAGDVMRYLRVPEKKICVVYNGIDPEFIDSYGNKSPENGYMLYVGRFDPYKNLSALIRVYAELIKDYNIPNKLLIVGQYDDRYTEVFKLVDKLGINNKVVFHGYADSKELIELYKNASLFVLPSLYEGFGIPPLEAMACGIPVIVSKAPALIETVKDNGISVDTNNMDEFKQAVYRVLTDRALRHDLAKKGKQRVKNYTIENMARETMKVYEEVIQDSRF